MVLIKTIEGESKQGMTQPLFCIGDDGARYVVKGESAGAKARICEWIAARLAKIMNLPIPPFEIMELDPRLLQYGISDYARRIGRSPAFGSLLITSTNEFQFSQIDRVPAELRARILLFDWWIANGDRALNEFGGNPNLLWNLEADELVVIDHNIAFDLDLCDDFWNQHVFKDDRKLWSPRFQEAQKGLLQRALAELPTIWSELPEQWTEFDCGINMRVLETLLWRFERESDNFWGHQ